MVIPTPHDWEVHSGNLKLDFWILKHGYKTEWRTVLAGESSCWPALVSRYNDGQNQQDVYWGMLTVMGREESLMFQALRTKGLRLKRQLLLAADGGWHTSINILLISSLVTKHPFLIPIRSYFPTPRCFTFSHDHQRPRSPFPCHGQGTLEPSSGKEQMFTTILTKNCENPRADNRKAQPIQCLF